MEKRVLTATLLSVIVIVLWWVITAPRHTPLFKQPAPSSTQSQTSQPADARVELGKNGQNINGDAAGKKTAEHPADIRTARQDTGHSPVRGTRHASKRDTMATVVPQEFTVETKTFRAVFDTHNATIIHWVLKEEKAPELCTDLVMDTGVFFATSPDIDFRLVSSAPGEVTFSGNLDKNIVVMKKFTLNESNYHKLDIEIKNTGNKAKRIEQVVSLGPGIGCDTSRAKQELSATKPIGIESRGKTYASSKLKKGDYAGRSFLWAGIHNRYFCIMLNLEDSPFGISVEDNVSPSKLNEVSLSADVLSPPGKTSLSVPFYLGPKQYNKLKPLGGGLEKIIDFGLFSPLSVLAFNGLLFLYNITGNYGMAIIILTIILQIVLLPLTIKSFKASAAMRSLQPKMKELQEKYKTDQRRLSAEMLNLYRSHKVNPLGGCLPMILQIPIFWALFTTLNNAYELRMAPFILWIKDLSSPDLLLTVSGLPIRVLPLLMGAAMYFQQRLSGMGTDSTQKTMTYLMPVMFTFIFWNFSSGLVLYWTINSIFSILAQTSLFKSKPETHITTREILKEEAQ
ncbi:MAG: membrane protein insertase YidC [Elusimicrobia bacterium]|nr:membrane protein insertase YidC [Elusimicrobiota bacterium]